jgi:DNA gyrase/topoisomerase IV subunit B
LRHACRGKLLNVRDATATQVAENQEIQNLKQILGLQYKKQYSDTKSLRYGHLMIMTDQDHDGSHIKGLIMNFLHAHYPELLQLPGFLAEFITPIVKVGSGSPHRLVAWRLLAVPKLRPHLLALSDSHPVCGVGPSCCNLLFVGAYGPS